MTTVAQGDLELVNAAEHNDIPRLSLLIDQVSDVNAAEADGTTALHWATHNGNLDMIQALLDAGADVNTKNRYDVAPLSLAANNGAPRRAAAAMVGSNV